MNSDPNPPPTPHPSPLTLPPRKIQITHQPAPLARRRKHTTLIRPKRRKGNLAVHIKQRLARATRTPHREVHVVLLDVLAVEGAVDRQRSGSLYASVSEVIQQLHPSHIR
jgi:hypothetical protein